MPTHYQMLILVCACAAVPALGDAPAPPPKGTFAQFVGVCQTGASDDPILAAPQLGAHRTLLGVVPAERARRVSA